MRKKDHSDMRDLVDVTLEFLRSAYIADTDEVNVSIEGKCVVVSIEEVVRTIPLRTLYRAHSPRKFIKRLKRALQWS